MTDMTQINQAIVSWQKILGDARVLMNQEALVKYTQDTTACAPRQIFCTLQAKTTDEIVAIVKVASTYQVPLYPISKGNNWGYGSANPVTNGCVILDLSGMDRIVEFDADLGTVSVEPGVTQELLSKFLKEHDDAYLTPVTGAGPHASILGNALERGYGLTPISDHFLSLMSLEAVLPDGSIYHSAIYEQDCINVDQIFKWGIGPYLDGLFTQSNFGIVTKITIQLSARPESVGAFIFEMRDEKNLEKAVALVRETLREIGGVTGSINIMNSLRLLSMSAYYPFEEIDKDPANYVNILKKMATDMDFAPWTCLGSFYGKKEMVDVAKRVLRNKVYPHTKRLIFLSRGQLNFLEKILSCLPAQWTKTSLNRIQKMKLSFDILEGRPNQIALPLCYRKMPLGLPDTSELNPARDGCGLIWYAPLVPMKPETVRTYVDFVNQVCVKHRIEPLITLTTLSDRCFDSTVPILFNPQNPTEVAQAKACFAELLEEGRKLGFFPYRANIDMMGDLVNVDKTFWAMQKTIKDAIDPQGIIAPRRYSAN